MSRASSSAIRCSSAPAKTRRRRRAAEAEAPAIETRRGCRQPRRTGSADDLETSRSSIEEGLGTELENVFPDDGGEKTAPAGDAAAGLFGMVRRRQRGGQDGDYNLEAFVSAETTLADHLAEQLALAISDPAGRMIGQYLIDMVDEAGYLTGDLDTVAEKLGAPRSRRRAGARDPANASIRPASARAISPNASPSSSRNAIASIRRCRRWSRISICWPSAILRALRRLLRRQR